MQLMLAAALASFVPVAQSQDPVPTVYRCRAAGGAIEYRDYPCNGGALVDIKPDAADPAAIARLQRAQAEFDRAIARRRSAEEAARRAEDSARERDAPEAPYFVPDAYFPDASYVPAYGYYAPYAPRSAHAGHRPPKKRERALDERRLPAVIRRPHPG
ncbi:MAG: hypothetical protein ACM3JC_08000 [Rudaea sp.]